MKRIIGILVFLCIIFSMCSCTDNVGTVDSSGQMPADKSQTEEVLDIENLKEDEFRISELPGKITVSKAYNVYSADNEYTEEMCAKQGITSEKMKLYIDAQKEYGGINMIIIPETAPVVSPDFEIQIKVNGEKDYKFENLADIRDEDFDLYKESLMSGFEASLNTDLTSDVYQNSKTKWIVFDCFMVNDQTRYATILNGKLVYVIGRSNTGPLTDVQKSEVIKIINSLQF